MNWSNYDDVLAQLASLGLVIPPGEGLRVGTTAPVRVYTEDDRREKRGWYILRDWSPSPDRLLIVGSFGVYRGNDSGKQKIALPKDDRGRLTPEQKAALQRTWREAAKAAQLQREKEQAAAAERARKMWARLAIEGESPYLASKGVTADPGLKFTPNGTAVLPLIGTEGRIHGLQFLRTAKMADEAKRPAKEFWPRGLAKQEHFHVIGAIESSWIVLIAEGYATARSLSLATGHPVVVAFDAWNLLPVASAIRARWKRIKIVVCADDDCWTTGNPGVTCASAAALAVKGTWLKPLFADGDAREARHAANGHKDTDFNDLHRIEGLAQVSAQVSAHLTANRLSSPLPRDPSPTTTGQGDALAPLESLDDMLQRYYSVYGGRDGVFDGRDRCLVTDVDVRNLCTNPDLFRAWKEHPKRLHARIDEIGFDPGEADPKIKCNLWRGWPTVPIAGKCDALLDVLQHLCSGERNARTLYDWVIKWLAYPIQHPGAKLKTALVLHGPQGTGKNLFFEAVMAIYGDYGRILDQQAVQDKHNDAFSRRLFMIADEVIANRDRYDVKNMLKTLITGAWIRINPKHVAAYDEANHVNLVFLSNEKMPVVIEEDDRRHCVIYTPGKREPAFYARAAAEVDSGGIAALHDYLLTVDLTGFHPASEPPMTDAKRELAALAQDSPAAFVDALSMGELPESLYLEGHPRPGLTRDWYTIYRRWCADVGTRPAPEKTFVRAIETQRSIKSTRERYTVDDEFSLQTQKGPHSMLTWWGACPVELGKPEWLGPHVAAVKEHLRATIGGGR